MPHTPDELFARLASLGIESRTHDHAPVFTVEEARALRGTIEGAHTKNLFLRDNKKTYFLVTVEEGRLVDLKRLRGLIGAKGGLSFGSPEALMNLLGVAPGSVSPFAAINDAEGGVQVFVDAALLEAHVVNAHPLTNTKTTTIDPRDLLRFLAAIGHPATPIAFDAREGTS